MATLSQLQPRGLLSSSLLARPPGSKADLSLLGRSSPTLHAVGDAPNVLERTPGSRLRNKPSGSSVCGESTTLSQPKEIGSDHVEVGSSDTPCEHNLQHAATRGLNQPTMTGTGIAKPQQDIPSDPSALTSADVRASGAQLTSDDGRDPWSGFAARTNAWDEVPEIERYTQALQGPRKANANVQILSSSPKPHTQKREPQKHSQKPNLSQSSDKLDDTETQTDRQANVKSRQFDHEDEMLKRAIEESSKDFAPESGSKTYLPPRNRTPDRNVATAFPNLKTPDLSYLESPAIPSSGLNTSPMDNGLLERALNFTDLNLPELDNMVPLFPPENDQFGQQLLDEKPGQNYSFTSVQSGRSSSSNASSMVRQMSSPGRPPATYPANFRPSSATISPPESDLDSGSEEDVTSGSRVNTWVGRRDNLEELRKAIRSIETRREASPERNVSNSVSGKSSSRRSVATSRLRPEPDLDHMTLEKGVKSGLSRNIHCQGLLIAHTISEDRTGNNEVVCSKIFASQRKGTDSPSRSGMEEVSSSNTHFDFPAGNGRHPQIGDDNAPDQAASDSGFESRSSSGDEEDPPSPFIKPSRKKSGELVRPALRASARRRRQGGPGIPTYSKAVHFDSHLEDVRRFLQVDQTSAVSNRASTANSDDEDTDFPFDYKTTPPPRKKAGFASSFEEAFAQPFANIASRIGLTGPRTKYTATAFGSRYDFTTSLQAALKNSRSATALDAEPALGKSPPASKTPWIKPPRDFIDTPWTRPDEDTRSTSPTLSGLGNRSFTTGAGENTDDAEMNTIGDLVMNTGLEPRSPHATSSFVTATKQPSSMTPLSYQELVDKYCFVDSSRSAAASASKSTTGASPELPAEIGAYGGN